MDHCLVLVCEDAAEVEAWAHRLVEAVGVDCEEPVRLEGKPEGSADFIFYSDIGIQGKERFFVKNCLCFHFPVVLVSVEEIE